MLKDKLLQCLSFILLVVTATAEEDAVGCRKLPADDYLAIMGCCKDSPIIYFEEVMAKCRNSNTSDDDNMINDLILTNHCEKFCYLNNYEVINKGGSIRKEKLVDFLKAHLPIQLQEPLEGFATKCLLEVESLKDFRYFPPTCHWYFTGLIDCIQGELFINCPESERVSSDMCTDSRVYVHYCGILGLRESFDQYGQRLNRTSVGEESLSDYGSDENSNSISSEYESSYEWETSDSSEFENETATESDNVMMGELTTTLSE